MRTYGTEGTSSKTSSVDVNREFYHLVCRNAFVLVFRVWQTSVRQVEDHVQFLSVHRWIRRIHHYVFFAQSLYDALCMDFV